MKNKKGATSISILLLVIMALVLCAVSLVSFIRSEGSIEKKMADVKIIEGVYVKSENIQFLVSEGESLLEAIKLTENSDLVGGKPNWVGIGMWSNDGKIYVRYEFEVKPKV